MTISMGPREESVAPAEESCPVCGHGNRAGARFCDSCGSPLEVRCTQGGNALRAGARFCDACGTAVAAGTASTAPPPPPERTRRDPRAYTPKHLADRILTSRTVIEGERKHVTVLFADVTGS